MKILLHPHRFNIGKAIKLTKHILEKQAAAGVLSQNGCDEQAEHAQAHSPGITDIPNEITFRRYAEWFRKKNYDKWILMREGEKSLADKVSSYIKRDISKIRVGEILVADGHKLNFLVLNPFTGKPARVYFNSAIETAEVWRSPAVCVNLGGGNGIDKRRKKLPESPIFYRSLSGNVRAIICNQA